MKREFIISFFAVIFFCVPSISQQDKSYFSELVPPSPDVAQLGQYGATQVGKYTGTANVAVPLHSVDFEGLQIPIALSYQTGGIRVDQEATWAGLGWTLSANAAISRQTNGYDDLSKGGALGYLYSPEYFFYDPEQNPQEYLAQELELTNLNRSYPHDLEPDLFTVSLFGKSIQFVLPKYNTNPIIEANVLNDRITRVYYYETENTPENGMKNTFRIVDGKGFEFYFGNPEGTQDIRREYTTTFRGDTTGPGGTDEMALSNSVSIIADGGTTVQKCTSWHIYKIKAPSGREIFFDYDEVVYYGYPSFSENYEFNICTADGTTSDGVKVVSYGPNNKKVTCSIVGFEAVQLKSISGDFGQVNFITSSRLDLTNRRQTDLLLSSLIESGPSVERLSGIQVRNIDNTLIKNITLTHSYFNSDKNQDTQDYKREEYLRLKLDQVTVDDKSYHFGYHYPDQLPSKSSKDVDFWGFYNAKGNTSRIPSFSRLLQCASGSAQGEDFYFNLDGANKSSDFNYGKIGLLKQVVYPTGGSTVFEYEANIAKVDRPNITIGDPFVDSADFSYNFMYLGKAEAKNFKREIVNNQEFTVGPDTPFGFNFAYTARSTCGYNCDNPGSGSTFLELENLNTGEFIFLERYYNTDGSPENYEGEKILAPGRYRFHVRPYEQEECVGIVCPEIVGIGASTVEAYFYEVDDPLLGLSFREFEVGGARLASVTNKDVDGSFISKKIYDYSPFFGGTVTAGILMNELVYHSKYGVFDYSPQDFLQVFSMTSGSSLSLDYSAQGSHIGYSYVEERDVDEQGNSNGFTVTGYVNEKNEFLTYHIGVTGVVSDHPINPRWTGTSENMDVSYGNAYLVGVPPVSYSYKNGSVVFDSIANSSGTTVRYLKNTYKDQLVNSVNVYKAHYAPVNITAQYFYTMDGNLFLPEVVETKEYFDGQLLKTTVTNGYEPNYFLPRSTSTTTSRNDKRILQQSYYPFDAINGISSKPYMQDLVNANRISEPVLTTIDEFVPGTPSSPISKTEFKYGAFEDGKIWRSEVHEGKADEPLTQRAVFESYDTYGNITEYRLTNGPPTSLIWGYNRQYPVAKIQNATRAQIEALSTDFQSDFHTGSGGLSAAHESIIRNGLPNAMVTTYTYKQGVGISSMTDPRGYTLTYEYDEAQRLKEVRDSDGNLLSDTEYSYKSITQN